MASLDIFAKSIENGQWKIERSVYDVKREKYSKIFVTN